MNVPVQIRSRDLNRWAEHGPLNSYRRKYEAEIKVNKQENLTVHNQSKPEKFVVRYNTLFRKNEKERGR